MNRIGFIILTAGLAVGAGGCLSSRLDDSWGRSHEAQVVWQTANPDAPVDREPAEGLDPETAQRIVDRYYEGQEKQRQRQAPSVRIGGSK